jgi:hypothetical protein
MSKTKNARILGIRLDETETAILAEIEAATTLAPVAIARAAITAVIRRWKTTPELALPFFIVTAAEVALIHPKPPAPYPVKTGAIETETASKKATGLKSATGLKLSA